MWLAFAAGLSASICSAGFAQERSAVKQGFSLPPNSQKKILLFRPAVRVGAQSTGGMFEPNAEWTEKAKANIEAALTQYQSRLGNQVVVAPEAYGEQDQNLQEYMSLFSAVSQAVIEYQFFVGNRLPTKKRDNKEQVFEWSLGDGVARLPGAQDADYGLFIYNRDAYGSTGRKVLQIMALMGGVSVTSGEHMGFAGLVDLKTGDLLWLNADGQMGGDVREPDGSEKRVAQLLEDFPGSSIGKAAK
ncbi:MULTISPECIES: hypothetical protein [unclassified Sphingobium]|uniref:hypothetical protein n=1 Tax=unclassified Sphingobium TaxID=2611147 RepID=UPI0022246618|nr:MULTISPECIES: hypothetical protein [unclassified Sphingobium]